MKKIKKFNVEIFFYKDEFRNELYSDEPNLEKYIPKGIMESITASDIKTVKKNLLEKYPNAAYIHIHYVSDYSI